MQVGLDHVLPCLFGFSCFGLLTTDGSVLAVGKPPAGNAALAGVISRLRGEEQTNLLEGAEVDFP